MAAHPLHAHIEEQLGLCGARTTRQAFEQRVALELPRAEPLLHGGPAMVMGATLERVRPHLLPHEFLVFGLALFPDDQKLKKAVDKCEGFTLLEAVPDEDKFRRVLRLERFPQFRVDAVDEPGRAVLDVSTLLATLQAGDLTEDDLHRAVADVIARAAGGPAASSNAGDPGRVLRPRRQREGTAEAKEQHADGGLPAEEERQDEVPDPPGPRGAPSEIGWYGEKKRNEDITELTERLERARALMVEFGVGWCRTVVAGVEFLTHPHVSALLALLDTDAKAGKFVDDFLKEVPSYKPSVQPGFNTELGRLLADYQPGPEELVVAFSLPNVLRLRALHTAIKPGLTSTWAFFATAIATHVRLRVIGGLVNVDDVEPVVTAAFLRVERVLGEAGRDAVAHDITHALLAVIAIPEVLPFYSVGYRATLERLQAAHQAFSSDDLDVLRRGMEVG